MFGRIEFLGKGPDIGALRTLAKSDPKGFLPLVERLAEKGELTLESIRSLGALYEGICDVEMSVDIPVMEGSQKKRTITTSAFPLVTSIVTVAQMNRAYDAVPTIGGELVDEIQDSKKITVVASIETMDHDQDEVKEKEVFPLIGASEDYVTIGHRKNGRRMMWTKEDITESTVNIIRDTNKLGQIAAEHQEELTLKRVTDYLGSNAAPTEYVYKPKGTGTALYSATANTPGTRAPLGTRIESNALSNETDLDAARVRLAGMKNGRGKRIYMPWSEVILLIPYALVGTASKIFNSELVPGVENEFSNYGPGGMFNLPKERIKTTPQLDDLSSTAWYLGAFKRQFVRKTKARMEMVSLGMNTEAYLRQEIVFETRVSWDIEIGATDYVFVIQNLSASTAPGD